jgi:hypothetical protein
MTMTSRRVFIIKSIAGVAAISSLQTAQAKSNRLDPNDSYAKSMGFVPEASVIDPKANRNWRKYKTGQACSKCQLWDGKEKDEYAACSFFGDQHTPRTGWCKNFKEVKS